MGQEIGITPLQLADLISTMANDGTRVSPRVVAAISDPQSAPQTIAFHPAEQQSVISPLTAAQMRQMMQGVVLHGTGTKAVLEGYSSAGKTGTAQKVDPATHAYSHTKYVGSFAGFAPVNNPAITIAVILDSAVGLHQGGQVAAPVFHRIAQQVLEYLHTPHDVELPQRKLLLASRQTKEEDLAEGSPDRLGDTLDLAESPSPAPAAQNAMGSASPVSGPAVAVVPTALRQHEAAPVEDTTQASVQPAPQTAAIPLDHPPSTGTVVLDLEQGGVLVPLFTGKSVRAAVELAQDSGLDLDVVGSGLAREQSPIAGTHVPTGAKITVRFAR